jgi:hypothetical protein
MRDESVPLGMPVQCEGLPLQLLIRFICRGLSRGFRRCRDRDLELGCSRLCSCHLILLHLLLGDLFPPSRDLFLLFLDVSGGLQKTAEIPVNVLKLDVCLVYGLGPVEIGALYRPFEELPRLSEVPPASAGQGCLVLHSRLDSRSKQDQLVRRRPRLGRRIDEQ